jgi:hypothetical protein
MNDAKMAKQILLKVFELANKGTNVTFEEDWGEGSITIYCGDRHTHCGFQGASEEKLIRNIYETLVMNRGLSFDIGLNEIELEGMKKGEELTDREKNEVNVIEECINNYIRSSVVKGFKTSAITKK